MVNGHDDAVALLQLLDVLADLDDHAHRLVAEDVARLHRRHVAVVEVQVGAADAGGRDLDDRVARVLDLRVGDGVDADVALAVPAEGSHGASSPWDDRVLDVQRLGAGSLSPVMRGRAVGDVRPVGGDGAVRPAAAEPLRAPVVQRRDPGDDRDRRGEVLLPRIVLREPRGQRGEVEGVPGDPGPHAGPRILHGEDGDARGDLAHAEERGRASPCPPSRAPGRSRGPRRSRRAPRPMLNQPRPRATFISFMARLLLSSLRTSCPCTWAQSK